jgi:phage gpG-like protein
MIVQKVRGNWPNFKTNLELVQKTLPPILANEAKNHFLEGFRQGGKQTDASAAGWKTRKKEYGKRGRRSNRALLIDTGSMRFDLKVRQISFKKIIVGIRNIPYAVYHNDGTDRMPQREIIGHSKKLERKLLSDILQEFKKVFR